MELRHIRYFVALAEELNFNRAAERLHISQPPLSRQIRELEEEIGVKLFHRTKRQVELTPAGRTFLVRAYEILDRVERSRISARLASTGQEGELRIGFTGTVFDLIPTLKIYQARFPHVGIILKQLSSSLQIKALHENHLDIGVLTIPVHSSKISTRPLLRAPFMAALPEDHPLADKQSLSIRDMAEETFIITLPSVGPLYYDTVMSLFRHEGLMPKIIMEAQDMHTVIALVSAGMGITLTPSPYRPVRGIVKKPVDGVNLSLQVWLAWRKDSVSEVLAQFLEFFNTHYNESDDRWIG